MNLNVLNMDRLGQVLAFTQKSRLQQEQPPQTCSRHRVPVMFMSVVRVMG